MRKGNCTLSPDKPFNQCCVQHDIDYTRKNKTRYQADRDFLRCMLQKSENSKLLLTMAYSYYYAVRVFGWWFWNKGGK